MNVFQRVKYAFTKKNEPKKPIQATLKRSAPTKIKVLAKVNKINSIHHFGNFKPVKPLAYRKKFQLRNAA